MSKRGVHRQECNCFVCRYEREQRREERKRTRAVRLSPAEDEALLRAANDANFTVSEALQSLINEGLKGHGYLPAE